MPRPSVLIVDAAFAVALSIGKALADRGCGIEVASTGASAFALLSARTEHHAATALVIASATMIDPDPVAFIHQVQAAQWAVPLVFYGNPALMPLNLTDAIRSAGCWALGWPFDGQLLGRLAAVALTGDRSFLNGADEPTSVTGANVLADQQGTGAAPPPVARPMLGPPADVRVPAHPVPIVSMSPPVKMGGPGRDLAALPPKAPDHRIPADSQSAFKKPMKASRHREISCHRCGNLVAAELQAEAYDVRCPTCGADVRVPAAPW